MDKQTVINFIEEAFEGVLPPKEITLHVAEAHDNYDYENNDEHRTKDFIGCWQNIPSSQIKACQNALCHVDKFGMHYYLPAYMVWYLKNMDNIDEVWTDHALYSLDNHVDDKMLAEYHHKRFSLFNLQQLQACALFVKYCAEDETGFADAHFAKEKYQQYWFQFDKNV